MNNRIVLILPYFGRFPNYFPYFLKSIENNESIDLLLFTDNLPPEVLPKNIKWVLSDLQKINGLIKLKIGDYSIKRPYKLCDFKPAFGHLFEDYIKEYDWWGWTDCDLIYGDILSFLNEINFYSFEKINYHGHFSLIKNNKKMNLMYRNSVQGITPFDFIFKSKMNFNFDEGGRGKGIYGFPNICKQNGVRQFFKRSFADVFYDRFNFRYKTYRDNNLMIHDVNYFEYKNRKLLSHENNASCVSEILYAHFQGRRFGVNSINDMNTIDNFFIFPNCFLLAFDESWNCDRKQMEKDFKSNLAIKKNKSKKNTILFMLTLIFTLKWFDKRWR